MRLQFHDSAIAEDFAKFYSIAPATSSDDLTATFRLRHDTFCSEYGYDMNAVEGLEMDTYDESSQHILLKRRETSEAIGCFRWISSQPAQEYFLPAVAAAAPHMSNHFDWQSIRRQSSAEISRFTLRSDTRAGRSELMSTAADPFLAASMFHAVVALGVQQRCENVLMVIEPRLARLTARFGNKLDQISPVFDCYGRRAAFLTHWQRMKAEADAYRADLRGLYEVVESSVAPSFAAAGVA